MKVLIAALLLAGLAGGAQREAALSSDANDYNLAFDGDERLLVLARSKADFRDATIYVAEKGEAGWSEPRPIGFSDPRWSDSDPWLTPDGRTLYFVSDRPTPARPDKKDLDIWRAQRTEAGWSAPQWLGDAVNGPGPELGPELHDGVLTFSSVRKGGAGGLDLYRAKRLPGGGFAPAEPLGAPFNSAASESDLTFSHDGRVALFWRMVGSKGVLHLARRSGAAWSAPRPLGAAANPGDFNFTPAFDRSGTRLFFASTAARSGQERGLADLYAVALADAER